MTAPPSILICDVTACGCGIADGSTVYCVLESGDVWTAIWTGSALEHLDDYTWADLARYT